MQISTYYLHNKLILTLILVAPIIDRDYLYKDKIWTRTGKVLKHENQPVDGEPAPKITWYHKVYIYYIS